MAKGKLIVKVKKNQKQIRIALTKSNGEPFDAAVPERELSQSLKQGSLEDLDGMVVECEMVGGQPKQIRPVGEPFIPATLQTRPSGATSREKQQSYGGKSHQHRSQPKANRHATGSKPAPPVAFRNPYNFIPVVPRNTDHPSLGDHPGPSHGLFHADRYSGVISVKMTTETPLLLPDAAKAKTDEAGHKSYPVKVDADRRPLIPPTSIKGMLRSAYESVTNSRLGVFPGAEGSSKEVAAGNGARLAFRRPARVEVVPARVEASDDNVITIRVLSCLWLNSAAKLPRYLQRPNPQQLKRKGEANAALRYADRSFPQHGDHVRVRVDPKGRVTSISRFDTAPTTGGDEGWVFVSEPNIGNKKYERVYVVSDRDQLLTFTGDRLHDIRQMWAELIQNYQQVHEKDLLQRRERGQGPSDYLGDTPGKTAWSRHVWDKDCRTLTTGTLCYVRFENKNIAGIYPVSISRDLYSTSPLALLDRSLRPAVDLKQLSPADRVFGWANQNGHGAYKGNVRIGPVRCMSADAIETFGDPGKPLAILGQPKPQQARFYVGDKDGLAQPHGISKEQAGYTEGKRLRGRKVYPHQRQINPQEYERQGAMRQDNQNRSIQGWVKAGTVFTFAIHVTNLSAVEIGALLWLLSLPSNHFHRFGGGKPLGFGSVRLDVDASESRIHQGSEWQRYYASFDDVELCKPDFSKLIDEFKNAVTTSTGVAGSVFDNVSFISAFLQCAKGYDDSLPTHYPRVSKGPDPAGENFKWFTNNESNAKVSLGNLLDDRGLPL